MHIFSDEEMERRNQLIGAALTERGVDIAIICSADNVYYCSGVPLLSGWGRPMWCVIRPDARPTIIGAAIEQENMENYGWAEDVLVFKDEGVTTDSCLRLARELIPRRGPTQLAIGIEKGSILHSVYEQLAAIDGVALRDVGDILGAFRVRKSNEEIALLRLGGTVAKIGAGAFVEALRPGVPELVVAAHAVEAMDRALAALSPNAATSSYSYCQFGSHSLTPHLHPTSRRVRRGDIVALNVFPVVWGYCVELERTYVLGGPTAEQDRLLRIVTEAFNASKAAIRPGVAARAVHEVAESIFTENGVSSLTRHGTGHAHGIMIGAESREEAGEFREYNRQLLEPGMLNSVEPGLYSKDLGGYRHSDVMLVTGDGAECLTEFPTSIGL